ncbi:MAG TPA: asparagine synthase (glutamine-hydrolyzing), partial [Aggregatilineales bacterium]|nr:asparagine synthase (glutamine-hydrolyzing) [Aggregatilineales bacterium]
MCGIYGQYSTRGADPALIERMGRCLAHRGPDGSGSYHHGPLAFGAGRLAIIDLEAGVQPVFSEDRRVVIVYNGEIYNYRALRAELERLGHCFATHTDTEVIVHGYENWGIGVLDHLRGMFALGIWDEPNEQLWLARDRLGEKPLYYAPIADGLLFASEIKALLEHPDLPRNVNREALPYYLTIGYVPPPLTMFQGVEKLAPGELLCIDRQGYSKRRYWQPHMDTTTPMDYGETVQQVRQTLMEAVEMRLMSDVPLGAFLSGGVDSTTVVAMMARAMGRPVQTFSVGFGYPAGSNADAKFNVDARYAAIAARALKTDHHSILIEEDARLRDVVPHLIYAMDEPIAQPAIIPTAYVSALARQTGVPVMLAGDAGDELFAGYTAYRADQVLQRYLGLPEVLRQNLLTPALESLPDRFHALRALGQKSRNADSVRRYLTWMKIVELDRLPPLLADPELAAAAPTALDSILR